MYSFIIIALFFIIFILSVMLRLNAKTINELRLENDTLKTIEVGDKNAK